WIINHLRNTSSKHSHQRFFTFLPLSFLLTSPALVCKIWYTHISNYPPLWHTLNITKIHEKSFSKFCKTQKVKNVKHLIYTAMKSHFTKHDILMLRYIHHFTSITHLIWNNFKFQNETSFSCLTNLTKLNIQCCKSLQNLDGISKFTR